MRAVRSVLPRTAVVIHRVPLAFRTRRFLSSVTPSPPSTPAPLEEGEVKQNTTQAPPPENEADKVRSRMFVAMDTAEEVLQHVAAPTVPLPPMDYVRALSRLERIQSKTKDRKFLQDPRFLDVLDYLSTSHFPASAVGRIAHSLKNLKMHHPALEKHLQVRAAQARAWLEPDALDSYIAWVPMVRDLDLDVLNQILAQVERQRRRFTAEVIVGMFKSLYRIPQVHNSPVIDVLIEEFIRLRKTLYTAHAMYNGFMGEFCHECAKLGKFTPTLVKQLDLSDYCTWGKDTMSVVDLVGLLGAFSEANIPIPDDIMQILAVRCTVTSAMRANDACRILYLLGRRVFEGGAPSPYVTPALVEALLRTVMQNLEQRNGREIGSAVYGLAGLPKTQGLEVAVRKFGLQMEKVFKSNAEYWMPLELMRVVEGFAGLSDVHQPSKFFVSKLYRNLDKIKYKLDYHQATRAVRALSVLPCDSFVIRTGFGAYFLDPEKGKFPSKETADEFQRALDELPTQEARPTPTPTPAAS